MKRAKFGITLIISALVLFVGAGAAHAQIPGYGPDTTPTTATPDIPSVTVVQGASIDTRGDGCAPGATVVITLDDGTVLATVTAGPDGTFVATITIPAGTTVGEHLVTATCGDVQQFLRVNVTAAGTVAPDNTTLARTGTSNIGPLLGIGAAAVVLGAAFVYGARRPRAEKV